MLTITPAIVLFACLAASSAIPANSGASKLVRVPLTRVTSLNSTKLTAKILGRAVKSPNVNGVIPVPIVNNHDFDYHAVIGIGNPPQQLRVSFDTEFSDLWIASESCKDPCCRSHRRYDHSKSNSYKQDGRKVHIPYGITMIEGFGSTDQLTFGSNVTLTGQLLVEATTMPAIQFQDVQFDGSFGLAFEELSYLKSRTPFGRMIEQHLVDEPVFSLYTKANASDSNGGELILGGIDQSKFTGGMKYVNVSKPLWQFRMDGIAAGGATFCLGGCEAVIDTGTYIIGGPIGEIMQLNSMLGVNFNYVIRDCDQSSRFPVVEFTIQGSRMPLGPDEYIMRIPDANGTITCYSAFRATLSAEWTLGSSFLAGYYTVFDYANLRVGFAKSI